MCCLAFGQAAGQGVREPQYYLSHAEVSPAAKEYYSRKWELNSNKSAFGILDSAFTNNDTTRPFYVYLVGRMANEAQGDLLVEVNIACKYTAELFPATLADVLFSNSPLGNSGMRDAWVKRMAVEIRVTCTDELMDCFKKSRALSLQNSTPASKSKMELLYNMVRRELNLFQQG